jgi:hypothetical protein
MRSDRSSGTPRRNAPVDPTTAHATGIAKTLRGIALDARSNRPSVKIVVGHGSPNVGCPG